MRLVVKIVLEEYDFENVCKITIADMLSNESKISKKAILSYIKHQVQQKGAFYVNFTGDANDEGAEYYNSNRTEVDKIYNKYFRT